MEKQDANPKKRSVQQLLQDLLPPLWKGIRMAVIRIGQMPFWSMALLCFALRVFVVYPFGTGAAILSGCIWTYWNLSCVKTMVLNGLWSLIGALGGHEQQSLWFEFEGRDEICKIIDRLSAQGVNHCNLVEQIDDLPPENQWYAICNGLNAMGVIAQTTRRALYITWCLPHAAAE